MILGTSAEPSQQDGVGVPQDDTVGVSVMFGIERHGRLVQDLGRVKTPVRKSVLSTIFLFNDFSGWASDLLP